MSWLALDVGGANLKAADGLGFAASVPFALWKAPGELAARLASLVADSPSSERIAVTMTGELCDCFATKAEGVAAILDAVRAGCGDRRIFVYLTDGRLTPIDESRREPLLAAASNWHALARFACRFSREHSLLVDIGSTTTDLVPLSANGPLPVGRTDADRLASGSLLYLGVDRTPICAVLGPGPVTWRGSRTLLATEFFATAADAYLLLDDLDEQPENTDTADGRPRTREAAQARLARMMCLDATTFSQADAIVLAEVFQQRQLAIMDQTIKQLLERLPQPPQTVLVSGQGEFLARCALKNWGGRHVVSLSLEIGPAASRCAPAHALAVLAREGAVESGDS